MPRKDGNSKTDKELIERIFLVLRGMTYAEIGKMLGKSSGGVGGWRTGASRPTIDDLRKIIEYTGISWDELLTGEKLAQQEATQQPKKSRPAESAPFVRHLALLAEYQVRVQEADDDYKRGWEHTLNKDNKNLEKALENLEQVLLRDKKSNAG